MTDPDARPSASPFWQFSLQFYRRPAVAEACLTLQEQAGVDVNLLLFLLWHATMPRQLTVSEVEELEGRIRPWREAVVIPLRGVRRALKSPPALVEAVAAEAFRTRIKAVELEAERLQQEAMHALAAAAPKGQPVSAVAVAARGNLAAYQQICRQPFPGPAIAALLAAMEPAEPAPV